MAYFLGVDTGGTYTDAVILDEAADRVIGKAKSLTTRGDLALGIVGVIIARQLPSALAGRLRMDNGREQPILRGGQTLVGGLHSCQRILHFIEDARFTLISLSERAEGIGDLVKCTLMRRF